MKSSFLNIPDYSGAVVYCIQNVSNGKKYIGSTLNLKHRIQSHIAALKGGYHNSEEMQSDFDNGDCFEITELYRSYKQQENDIKTDVRIKEYYSIIENDCVNNGYNNYAFKVFADIPKEYDFPDCKQGTFLYILRRSLVEKDLKVSDLARLLNTSYQNLDQKLKRDNFSEKEMLQIAEVLDLDLEIELKEKK